MVLGIHFFFFLTYSQWIREYILSHFSCDQLFAALLTVAHQGPLSMGFFRQEYWSGLPWPPPGHLFDPGMEPSFLTSPALTGGFFTTSAIWEAQIREYYYINVVCTDYAKVFPQTYRVQHITT